MQKEYIKKIFNKCNVGKLLGIDIYEIGEGLAKGKIKIKKEHINIFGSAHGGILFTFADHVGGACGNTLGKKAVLVESSIQYMRGVPEGDTIFAEATLTHRGRKIGRIDVKVCRENGEIIAIANQVFFIKDDKHETEITEDI